MKQLFSTLLILFLCANICSAESRTFVAELERYEDKLFKFDKEHRLISAAKHKNSFLEVALLLNAGNAINMVDGERGYSPLMWAIENGAWDIVYLLLSKGADTNIQGEYGYTALRLTVSKGKTWMSEFLIKKGADVNVADDRGYTPLMIASGAIADVKPSSGIVRLLLNNGADINARCVNGKRAIDFAKDINIIALLTKTETMGSVQKVKPQVTKINKLRKTKRSEYVWPKSIRPR